MEHYPDKHIYDLAIIGGGASGLMMASVTGHEGVRTLLLEKNNELGKKLSISGGGRCNITNAEEDVRALLHHYGDAAKFLHSPFAQFGVPQTFEFFEKLGLPIVVEARKRAFPKTQSAPSVTEALERYIRAGNVEIHKRTAVKDISITNNIYTVTTKKGEVFTAKALAVATGGLAAPETGSTGDGFRFLESFGHTIKDPNPNIVPLQTTATWVHDLAGTTLSFMKLSFVQDNKVKLKRTGKVLFTHFGISGPLVLNCAGDVKDLLHQGEVMARIDLFPDTDLGALDKRLLNIFEQHKNKQIKNVLPELLPKTLAHAIIDLPHIDLADTAINNITKEQRKALVHTLKRLEFPITDTLGYDWAVIADGGVLPEEIDWKTMESKLHSDLYLLGDVISINRPSGGYSLQLCWTTGYVAAQAVAKRLHSNTTLQN